MYKSSKLKCNSCGCDISNRRPHARYCKTCAYIKFKLFQILHNNYNKNVDLVDLKLYYPRGKNVLLKWGGSLNGSTKRRNI